jgi:hypothetical protein
MGRQFLFCGQRVASQHVVHHVPVILVVVLSQHLLRVYVRSHSIETLCTHTNTPSLRRESGLSQRVVQLVKLVRLLLLTHARNNLRFIIPFHCYYNHQ